MIFDVFYYDLQSNFYDKFVFKSESKNHRGPDKLRKCFKVYKNGIEFEAKNRQWAQKTQKDEKLVSQKIKWKMQTYINRIEQNNNHTRIMHKIRFWSSFTINTIRTKYVALPIICSTVTLSELHLNMNGGKWMVQSFIAVFPI